MRTPGSRRLRSPTRALLALALAGVAHGLALLLILSAAALEARFFGGLRLPAKTAPQRIILAPMNAARWAENRQPSRSVPEREVASAKEELPKAVEEKKRPPEVRPDGQVVAVAPGNDEESPDAKYLAESNNRVQRETRAREQTAFYRNAMPQRTATMKSEGNGRSEPTKDRSGGNNGLGEDDRPLLHPNQDRGVVEIPSVQRRQEVAMKTDPRLPGAGADVANRKESEEVVGNSNRLKIQEGDPTVEGDPSRGKQGAPGVATLVPSLATLDRISGAAANDHLDAEEGDGTYLNTRQWKYASFFNRVKQSVGMHWDPLTQYRLRDPTGTIYGTRDRHTSVMVTLNDRGMLKDIYISRSCGLDFLDLEAVRSFERAQPFPNPPPGLLEADQTVHFAFSFVIESGPNSFMGLFRQAN